jgi:hypothetical protein
MSRIRVGEAMSALGALGLLGLLLFDWVGIAFKLTPSQTDSGIGVHLVSEASHGSLSGWGTLGWLMDVLLAIAIFGGLCLPYMVARRTSPAWPVGAAVLTWAIGAAVVLILVVRVLYLARDQGVIAVNLQLPAYAGVLFAALIPLGAFLSLKDERKDSAEARDYTPPPARSVPGT